MFTPCDKVLGTTLIWYYLHNLFTEEKCCQTLPSLIFRIIHKLCWHGQAIQFHNFTLRICFTLAEIILPTLGRGNQPWKERTTNNVKFRNCIGLWAVDMARRGGGVVWPCVNKIISKIFDCVWPALRTKFDVLLVFTLSSMYFALFEPFLDP